MKENIIIITGALLLLFGCFALLLSWVSIWIGITSIIMILSGYYILDCYEHDCWNIKKFIRRYLWK